MKRLSGFLALALFFIPRELPLGMEVSLSTEARALESPFRVLRGTITRNATLESLLDDVLSREAIHHLLETARPLYDLARLSVGHPFDLTLGPDGLLAAFSYGVDEIRTLRIRRKGGALEAEIFTKTHDVRTETIRGVVTSSLFGAVTAAGEEDQLALDLAAVFEWDVDFNTELQKGDSFRVAVEKTYVEGRFTRYGPIVAAELLRGPRVLRAVRFEGPPGATGYYSPDGVPMRKAFLRSPLKFSRITSRFSRARLHPILGERRPHLGVDYAAPAGTPVRAAADGVVVQAGSSGGYGKIVRIRHTRGLETLYGHLSRIAVHTGQRVSQGLLIGTVGSTGLATGPHLDYRISKDGVFVNPLKMTPPPPEPIPAFLRAAFEAARDLQLAVLDGQPSPSPALALAPGS